MLGKIQLDNLFFSAISPLKILGVKATGTPCSNTTFQPKTDIVFETDGSTLILSGAYTANQKNGLEKRKGDKTTRKTMWLRF